MNDPLDDKTPLRYDPHRTSATNGESIPRSKPRPVIVDPATLPVRPEYGAPRSSGALFPPRRERGMTKLTREQYDDALSVYKRALDEGWATPAWEIAGQLREEVRDLEVIHSGSFDERLEAIAAETDESDDWTTGFASLLVKMALHVMRAP